jgi:hypothetical protein
MSFDSPCMLWRLACVVERAGSGQRGAISIIREAKRNKSESKTPLKRRLDGGTTGNKGVVVAC